MDIDRRQAMTTLGAAAAGFAAAGLPATAQAQADNTPPASGSAIFPGFSQKENAYVQEPLPYAYDALEPYIDAKTMELHYSKHAAGYVRGVNNAMKKLAEARAAGDYSLVEYWSNELTFNGGGHTLHTIFWQNMAPHGKGGGGEPTGALAKLIDDSFGSFEAMKNQFTATAATVEGSGWGVMAKDLMSGKLIIFQAKNQQMLTTWACMPVLLCDVWEHAYYLKYNNRRRDYINAWWNVVNWSDVARHVS